MQTIWLFSLDPLSPSRPTMTSCSSTPTADAASPTLAAPAVAPNATVPAVTLFISGLGLDTPPMQVAALVTMLTGVRVLGVPVIVKNTRNASVGARVRVPAQDADKVIATLHHRVLIDDKGVFFAADPSQLELLDH
jgi:hypothetical protein